MAKKKTSSARPSKRPTNKKAPSASRTKAVSRTLTKKPARKPTARTASARKTAPTSNGSGHQHSPITRADPETIRKIKSPLTARELRDYRSLLMTKRAEILGDMKSMSHEALNGDAANLSHMPIHMADVGSDHYEQELTLGLVESERKLLHEIDDAIERIAEGTYGVCQATGKPIGKPRLQAKPWAKYCIEAARELERNGGRW